MTALTLPNSTGSIQQRVAAGKITWRKPVLMLFSRLFLFAGFQALIAAGYALLGDAAPWQASTAWWPVSATLANLVCIFLLDRLARAEGIRLLDIYRAGPHSFWRELGIALAAFVVCAVLAVAPNIALGSLLFSDPTVISNIMFQPLPPWAIYPALVLFPVTIALAELPVYAGYCLPRLSALNRGRWTSALWVALVLSIQHAALPLVFDGRFLLYRLLVFLPFALWVIAVLRWRPRLLPYLMIGHGLIDASTVIMILGLSGK